MAGGKIQIWRWWFDTFTVEYWRGHSHDYYLSFKTFVLNAEATQTKTVSRYKYSTLV